MRLLEGVNVAVTGGAGFIGSHLVSELVCAGAHVTVVDRQETSPSLRVAGTPVTHLAYDLTDPTSHAALAESSFDYLFHLAGNSSVPASVEDPRHDCGQNLLAFLGLLEAHRRAKRSTKIVFVSSAAVYGNPVRLPIDEADPTIPVSPYGVSKLAAERYAAVYAGAFQVPTLSVRIFSCYGPGQRKQVVYDLITRLLNDPHELRAFGTGAEARDFIYVRDVAAAMVHLAAHGRFEGETYNLASGRSHAIAELIAEVCGILRLSPRIEYSGHSRIGDPDVWVASIERLRSTGFTPSTPLHVGLHETVHWALDVLGKPHVVESSS